jgi:hypothetical protein
VNQSFRRAVLALITLLAVGATTATQRAYAEQQYEQGTYGWCAWACGLATGACCVFAPELCEVCAMGAQPCIDYCEAHYPNGA